LTYIIALGTLLAPT